MIHGSNNKLIALWNTIRALLFTQCPRFLKTVFRRNNYFELFFINVAFQEEIFNDTRGELMYFFTDTFDIELEKLPFSKNENIHEKGEKKSL